MLRLAVSKGASVSPRALRCPHARHHVTRRLQLIQTPHPAARFIPSSLTATSLVVTGGAVIAFVNSLPPRSDPEEAVSDKPETPAKNSERNAVGQMVATLYMANLLLTLSLSSPATQRLVRRHFRCSYEGITKGKRWHTLLTSSLVMERPSNALLVLTLIPLGLDTPFEPYFDMAANGGAPDPLAASMPEGGMPRQLPLWGFVSLFTSSVIASNVLELRARRKAYLLNIKRGRSVVARASFVSPLAAVLTWSMIARDQFGLALMGPAVAIVGAARGSKAMIGVLGAYAMVALHWQQQHQHASQLRSELAQTEETKHSSDGPSRVVL
ncbi:hypothetical protein P43SY_001014 [Pythium insidiosum]|uniref:Uncharacterized protein n=1 Tax=Pythium insidiosum TaxID=114742 RepID=A0AAD5QB27_PYTIN|nr:hypothetical protein P43SY_001014 [Pythium insidiosum]